MKPQLTATFPTIAALSVAALTSLVVPPAIAASNPGSAPASTPETPDAIAVPPVTVPPEQQVAQFFPPASTNEQVLMVLGQSTATAPAETAEMKFILLNYNPYYDPYYCESFYYDDFPAEEPAATEPATESSAEPIPPDLPPECAEPPSDPQPISRVDLQPIVDALVAFGIDQAAIQITLPTDAPASYSYSAYPYYPDAATLEVSLMQPTAGRVADVVAIVDDSIADRDDLYVQDRYVDYTLGAEGCAALEQQAYQEAVVNARERANLIAASLGVELGDTPSVADSIFTQPGSPFGTYPSYCDLQSTDFAVPFSPYGYTTPSYYDPNIPAEVRLQRGLFVTFPIR